MKKTKQPEHRQHERVEFNADVTIYPVIDSKSGNVLEIPSDGITVQCRDISEGGISLQMAPMNSSVSIVKINFKLRAYKPVDAFAKLIWNNGGACGFQYIILDDKSRSHIRGFVNENK